MMIGGIRSKHEFGERPLPENAKYHGVTEVIGPQDGVLGLYFVTRNSVRHAVIAESLYDAAGEVWQPDFWRACERRYNLPEGYLNH